uniref:Pectinesterase n=1 Tax=Aegilops tauschii TaxID=37682 RepID=M8B1H1_AEGTA
MGCDRHHVVSLLVFVLVLLLRWPALSSARASVSRTITVDKKGRGDFRSVQPAVDSVPDGNREEKVTIPKEKRYILLEGEGHSSTEIYYDASNADDFVARDIAFMNSHNGFEKRNVSQAVAALVGGDQSAFYGCAFTGFQDTLCDYTGRHYFRGCFIKGAVDFIFGYGQSIYDGCTVVSNVPMSHSQQPGLGAGSPGGLVFKGGEIGGTGRQYLGRAWNKYATVVFYHVNMSGVVIPQGWDGSKNIGPDTMFAEVGITGPGSDMAMRVPWEKASDRGGGEEVHGHQLHR